jgi:effector-binding domain-containing protein
MKKAVRFAGILILLLIVLILVLGVIAPKDVTISRSIIVNAQKASVMEQVTRFKNWPAWSPWQEKDSAMLITYSGTDGQPGSGYHWKGDEHKVGEGEMKNIAVSDTGMTFDIDIIKPWTMHMPGSFTVKDTNGATKMTWSVTKHTDYPFNASNMFVNIDKYMGGDFEHGLDKLKKVVESKGTTSSTIEIKEIDYPAHLYMGVRSTVYWSDLSAFFNKSFMGTAPILGSKISGPGVGIFYTWDTVAHKTDVLAAFPVTDTSVKKAGIPATSMPAGKAVTAVYKGGYSGAYAVHNAIKTYMMAKHLPMGVAIEEYAKGPHETPDSNSWVTNVYYLVR